MTMMAMMTMMMMYTLWGDDDDDDDNVHLVGRPLAPAVVIVGTVSSREDLGVHPA